MKKLFTLLSLTLLLVGGVFAQNPEQTNEDPNAPKIEFESKLIDYGTIKQGENGVRFFKFTNTGNQPLIITNCKGSCGCTVPQCPTKPVLPGQSGEIQVKYDTNRKGPFSKTVTVKSNASNGTVYLKIKGNIEVSEQPAGFPANEDKKVAPRE